MSPRDSIIVSSIGTLSGDRADITPLTTMNPSHMLDRID
jgi:hypothetical protein